jgi:hypothetical protein
VIPHPDGGYRIRVTATNEGFLPTSLTGRGAVGREGPVEGLRDQVVRPPTLHLHLDGAVLREGRERVLIRHLKGTGPFLPGVGWTRETVEWVVEPLGSPAYVQVTARSDKAGVVRSRRIEVR